MIDEISVWPYAIYYPYYEQYTTIFSEALIQDYFQYQEKKSFDCVSEIFYKISDVGIIETDTAFVVHSSNFHYWFSLS